MSGGIERRAHARNDSQPASRVPQRTFAITQEYKKLYFQRDLENLEYPHGYEFGVSKSQKD